MPTRARIVSLVGLVLVPSAAYYVPYVSGYASVVIGAALAFVLIWAKPASPVAELGLRLPPSLWRSLAFGAAAGIALLLINRLALTPLLERLTGSRRDLSAFEYLRGNGRALFALLPSVWVSAGLCEEIVYRGYLISQVAKLLGKSRPALPAALLFAATVFALAHWYQGLVGMLVTGAIAVLLGLLFLQQRGNLWANVAAHVVADTASLAAITLSWDRWLSHFARTAFL
jgi:membrane protease YdiL (CAAX protease family)